MNSNQEGDDPDARGRSNPLFDPVAGMRAMADIQADALRAASELLERMLASDQDVPSSRSSSSERQYAALFDAWAELLQRVAGGLARPVQDGAVAVPVDSDHVGPPVRVVFESSEHGEGGKATEVWLHNGTSAAVGPLSMRCGPLTAPDGTVLESAQMLFDPAEIAQLPPRSSRAVLVSLLAAGALRAGIYRGTIQADGAPRLWMPVEVEVRPC